MKSLNVISLGIFLLCCSQHAYAIGPNEYEATPAQQAHQQAVRNAAIFLNAMTPPSEIIEMTNNPNDITDLRTSRRQEYTRSTLDSLINIATLKQNQDHAEK